MPQLTCTVVFYPDYVAVVSNYDNRQSNPISRALTVSRAEALLDPVFQELVEVMVRHGYGHVPYLPFFNATPTNGRYEGKFGVGLGFRTILELLPSLYALGYKPLDTPGRPMLMKKVATTGGSSKRSSNKRKRTA